MDRLKKVFNGDERLVITYWVWGLIGGFVYGFSVGFVLGLLGFTEPLLISILTLPFLLFIWVSIWRSSGKYQGPTIWAILAKIAVVLGVIGFIYQLANPVV